MNSRYKRIEWGFYFFHWLTDHLPFLSSVLETSVSIFIASSPLVLALTFFLRCLPLFALLSSNWLSFLTTSSMLLLWGLWIMSLSRDVAEDVTTLLVIALLAVAASTSRAPNDAVTASRDGLLLLLRLSWWFMLLLLLCWWFPILQMTGSVFSCIVWL